MYKTGVRFMESIPSNFVTLLNSLSDVLQKEITNKKDEKCL